MTILSLAVRVVSCWTPLQFSVIVAHMWRIYTLPKEVVFNIDDIVYFQD